LVLVKIGLNQILGKSIFIRAQSSTNSSDLFLGSVDENGYNTITGDLLITVLSIRGTGSYTSWKVAPSNISTNSYTAHIYQNWDKTWRILFLGKY
jgi:hypothetical protein